MGLPVARLALAIIAASVPVAVDRTVLNAGYVPTTLEAGDAAAQAGSIVLEQLPTGALADTNEAAASSRPDSGS